jgi:signal transduction histidine kinase/CheY-like chemotaxis protein
LTPQPPALADVLEQLPLLGTTAGDFARPVTPVLLDASCDAARQAFAADRTLYAIPVLDESARPAGLLNRFKFLEHLATRFGHALSTNRTAGQYMEAAPLIVDEATPIDRLAALLANDDHHLFDGFIVTRDGAYLGVGTGAALMRALDARLLERTRSLELEIAERRRTETELVVAKAAAEAASIAKSTFLANMSHELRTPLNAIIGYSELLLEDVQPDAPASNATDLACIVGAGRHLLALITGILDLSKVEAGRMELDIETFDLATLIQGTIETSRTLALARRNRVSVEGLEHLGNLTSDRTKVQQVLLNLLSNACKFTERGAVTVRARTEQRNAGEWAVIDVVDTGVGMTPEQCGRVFQEFIQADATTTRRYGGTGLGLAISQRLCHLMRGTLTVESELGRGSVFTVRLPVILGATGESAGGPDRSTPAEAPLKVEAPPPAPAAHAISRRPTVLVVDDDAAARDLLSRTLEKAGFATVTAASAEEGLDLARAVLPDALVSDVLLPGMTGWNLIEAFKAEPALCDIPVVVLSVIENRRHSLGLGAVEHLTKPVVTDMLVTLLKSATASSCGADVGTRPESPLRVRVAS